MVPSAQLNTAAMNRTTTMNLVNFDVDILDYLIENGYTHAVIVPLYQGEIKRIRIQHTMELVPFRHLSEAQHYLYGMEALACQQSTIIDMTQGPEEAHVSNAGSTHLLIDTERLNLAA